MILADKIIKLRKQLGWSQEDLAEKMDVSRQSVSKWESAASIPDLNKIILMADIFGVTTDYLVKDEIEHVDSISEDKDPGITKVTLENAANFVKQRIAMSKDVSIGVMICIYSVVPLFFLLALSYGEQPMISENLATGIGLVLLLVAISVAVNFFLRSSRSEPGFIDLEKTDFELSYGVESVYKEKLHNNHQFYVQRLSICISMIIISVVPLILSGLFTDNNMVLILMLVLMFVMIGISLYLMIPVVMENNAYNIIVQDGDYAPERRMETRKSEKFGAFYWPLVTAIYLGWSLFTMNWGITWVVWPVAGVAFAGFVGLFGLVSKEK